ncbi:uromodulin-like 1 isoform X1 [Lithobates pipiens]
MDRKDFLYLAVILGLAADLGSGQMLGNMISPASYHVCDRTVTLNISKVVPFQKPHVEKSMCMGWIPWKLCSKTYYVTEYRTIWVPDTMTINECCEGYELVGHYCAISAKSLNLSTSRPGVCPAKIDDRVPCPECTADHDCPGFQKCCETSAGSFCVSPQPPALDRNTIKFWYNGTITIKMKYFELVQLDPGYANHTRLLHSMITGELWPIEAAVYHISTQPSGLVTIVSCILIGINESVPLQDITTSLNNIAIRLPEVLNIQIDDLDECLHRELGACPPSHDCINTEGSFSCKPHSAHQTPPGPGINVGPSLFYPNGSTNHSAVLPPTTPPPCCINVGPSPFYPNGSTNHSVVLPPRTSPPCYCSSFLNHTVSNVTTSGFHIRWSTDCPDNHIYNIQITSTKEIHRNDNVSGTSLNISGLNYGELYTVQVTFLTCSGETQLWEEKVKTEGQILNGTLKIENWNLTEPLQNPNSSEYAEFVKTFTSEVKESLSSHIPPDQISVQILSLSPGSIVTNFLIIINGTENYINVTSSSLSAINQSSVFKVDPQSIKITEFNECLSSLDNDCDVHAYCKDLQTSFTCECHPTYVDRDPSRPGRKCESTVVGSGLLTTSMTSTEFTDRTSSTTSIYTSPPTTNSTVTTTQPSTKLPQTTTATDHMTFPVPASEIPATGQLVLSTPTTVTTGPALTETRKNESLDLIIPTKDPKVTTIHTSTGTLTESTNSTSTRDQNLMKVNATKYPDHIAFNSTNSDKENTTLTSTVHPKTEPSMSSSTANKGFVPVTSTTAKLTTAQDLVCSLSLMSNNQYTESTSTPLLAFQATTTPHAPSLTLKDASKVICETGRIGISIEKSFLNMMSISSLSLFLGSPECSVNCSTDTHVLIQAGWNDCSTDVFNNKTHTVVNSTLYIDLSATMPNITPRAVSLILCVFQNNILWSSGYNPAGGFYTIIEKLEGGGSFFPEFQLFIGDQPIPSNFTLSATDDITVRIWIRTEEDQFKVVINECWATPTEHAYDPVSFPFIKDSCALGNTFTTIQTNGVSSNATFQTKIFSFVNNPIVYLHCRLSVCREVTPNACKPSCSSYRASVRSGDNVFTGVTRMGPLRMNSRSNGADTPANAALGPGYIILIAIGVLAVIAIITAILVCWYQRRTGNYNFKMKTRDVGYQVFSN